MPVADTLVTLGEQCIDGDLMFVNVRLDLSKGPREEGVQFQETGAVYLEWGECRSGGALRSSAPCYDGLYVQFGVGSLSGLDLDDLLRGRVREMCEIIASVRKINDTGKKSRTAMECVRTFAQ